MSWTYIREILRDLPLTLSLWIVGGSFAVGLLAVVMVFNAWAIMTVWNWHMVHVGLPVITMIDAMVIAILVGYITQSALGKQEEKKPSMTEAAIIMCRPILVVAAAWVLLQLR